METTATLPSYFYFDEDHYRKEVEAIWCKQWICVGRFDDLSTPGSYRVVEVDDQSIVVVRTEKGDLRAFHNTCRHRGSILCDAERGHFENGRVVCPYHAWTYSLEGALLKTPWRLPSDDFDAARFSLYRVGIVEWAGYIFINLNVDTDATLQDALSDFPARFANWDLGATKIVHRMVVDLACNWKIFWENFQECYHCPGVHPELCRVVPVFGKGFSSHRENPQATSEDLAQPRLAAGAKTWTLDGESRLPSFAHLSSEERAAGHTYGVSVPSCYLVGHIDYARMVHMMPTGAQSTRLTVDWMASDEAIACPEFDVEEVIALGKLVVEQDGRACELNQKGLRARRHKAGVLVTQERSVAQFQDWVRDNLETAPPS